MTKKRPRPLSKWLRCTKRELNKKDSPITKHKDMKYYIQDNIDETRLPVVFDNHSDALDYIFDNDLTITHEIIAQP
jgi:hypothetical protein